MINDPINDPINDNDDTLLICAVCDENLDEVKKLLDQGADMTIRNKDGDTALTYAFDSGNLDLINLLV